MSAPRQWFRMYAEAVDDDKLRLLAFEDRWHFVALLCLKASGTLDSEAPYLERRIAVKLGLQLPQLDELKRRLIDVDLINEQWQPIKWGERQYESDDQAKAKHGYVYFIGTPSGGDIKVGYSKNPWARILDIKSETGRKALEVLATVRTTSRSEVAVHDLLEPFRKNYEWFERCSLIESAIAACTSKSVNTEEELIAFLRSNYVVTTNRAESEQKQSRAEQSASVSPAGEFARTLRDVGVIVNVDHPTLRQWVSDGFTKQQLLDSVSLARQRKPHPEPIPANYIDKILRQPARPPPSAIDRVTWRPPPDEECA